MSEIKRLNNKIDEQKQIIEMFEEYIGLFRCEFNNWVNIYIEDSWDTLDTNTQAIFRKYFQYELSEDEVVFPKDK
mgnify:CR=1 FL=1